MVRAYAADMDVALLSVADAAEATGRSRSGLHKLVGAGKALTDPEGQVVVVDGRIIASLPELLEVVRAAFAKAHDAERAQLAAQDELALVTMELAESKVRSAQQLQAVVEANAAAALALRELVPRS